MAYICYMPWPCKNCPHYRWDDDRQTMCCWAAEDEKSEADKKSS